MAAPPAVPRLWPQSTIVCMAGGPSLTADDAAYCRGRGPVIAINSSYKLAPWADVLYACDNKWWGWPDGQQALHTFRGLKFALDPRAKQWPGVTVLRNTGDSGLELNPTGLRTGRNSGFQAINLALHLGAARVILLGYDMHGGHWHKPHPDGSRPPFPTCLKLFPTLVEPLKAAGVEVINCTPGTALTAFPCRPLREVLPPLETPVEAALEVSP